MIDLYSGSSVCSSACESGSTAQVFVRTCGLLRERMGGEGPRRCFYVQAISFPFQ